MMKYSEDTFPPRNYQTELMKIALEQNTIIFLPTGSGKTYIAIMVMRRFGQALIRPYSEGGKLTFIVTNSVALVDQHKKNINDHTPFSVCGYTGDMNVDNWNSTQWIEEFNKYKVFIMTSQIMLNLVNQGILILDRVNLLIFDECHHGVNDHPMRQIMFHFQRCQNQPRVLGLTATLLNRNCKPSRVMEAVRTLEVTYHSQVATVDELVHVVGFSTNPVEDIVFYHRHNCCPIENLALHQLRKIMTVLNEVRLEPAGVRILSLPPLEPNEGLRKMVNLIDDLVIHIEALGIYGGLKACISHMVQVERIKLHCSDVSLYHILNAVLTVFGCVKSMFVRAMQPYSERDKIFKFSSNKVLQLIKIFQDYPILSKETLCSLVFVQRRFTAKVLHLILDSLSKCDINFSYIKSNFMVGYNNNPYNNTREALYISKKNRNILDEFSRKEINVLVASSLLEEGVDIVMCTLVIKFDKPLEYRSYVQSKGRARHKTSLYYIMVEGEEAMSYKNKYQEFKEIEGVLNELLIGQNDERDGPNRYEINQMYQEGDIMQPYIVPGNSNAQVNMLSAISLLCQYCNSLHHDRYTMYAPDWYVRTKTERDMKLYSVVIMMPVICPLHDPIVGAFMVNKMLAKRAAALEACKLLHQCGELDDNLLPRKYEIPERDVSFLFRHWPSTQDKQAGNSKSKRLHKKQPSIYTQGQITPDIPCFLHIIELCPEFEGHSSNLNDAAIYDMYTSNLCFGVLTVNPFPELCSFPVYVSLGTIRVSVKNNIHTLLSGEQVKKIRRFHTVVFKDLLEILKPFLVLEHGSGSEHLLIVPVEMSLLQIDSNVLDNLTTIKDKQKEPKLAEKQGLVVSEETYLHKIVTPWYRRQPTTYLVTKVHTDKTPSSRFPNEEHESFLSYYAIKYQQNIYKLDQPLLSVKGLSKKVNLTRPRGREAKRKREKNYEELEEILVPELLIKQDFPASLWVQATLLPTILMRLTQLLKLEELRQTIAREAKLGKEIVENPACLELDLHILNYDPLEVTKCNNKGIIMNTNQDVAVPVQNTTLMVYNKDFAAKMLEVQYPWKDLDEPKDLERVIDVTLMDVEFYENFIGSLVPREQRVKSPVKIRNLPAITYHKDFIEKDIKLLSLNACEIGPELADMVKALTTAKATDIVNLERLETLGDSFLKFISSTYITIRFPTFDEGKCSLLKGRLVSNKNLYYHALGKNLGGILKHSDLASEDWLPPSFKVPDQLQTRIMSKDISIISLFYLSLSEREQITGVLDQNTVNQIDNLRVPIESEDDENNTYTNSSSFLRHQYIGDKFISDCVESLIGVFCEKCGISGGIKFIEWMGIIPASENLMRVLKTPPPNPVINKNLPNIEFHIPQWKEVEQKLGYTFKNRAYLLQALTHSSYGPNRTTHCYQKLEFLGDAVLDFLITCFIYESCGNLNPGELTDLRSALVNNNTFGSFVVRYGFHKYLLMMNSELQMPIDKFAEYLASKNYEIDDEVFILLEEADCNIAEFVDVPKILGDIFEALAGAIFLDSNYNLDTVWKVFYKIMWKEIDHFSQNVPKNVIRRLFEWPNAYPEFSKSVLVENKTMISVEFILDGRKKVVHGFGDNKVLAKKAAAKLALRALEK